MKVMDYSKARAKWRVAIVKAMETKAEELFGTASGRSVFENEAERAAFYKTLDAQLTVVATRHGVLLERPDMIEAHRARGHEVIEIDR